MSAIQPRRTFKPRPDPLHLRADQERLVETLREFGPLGGEYLQLRAGFASRQRFTDALNSLLRSNRIYGCCGRKGYCIPGDTRPLKTDNSDHVIARHGRTDHWRRAPSADDEGENLDGIS